MLKCGTCQHAKTAAGLPLGGRLCKGAPPQNIMVPGQGPRPGQIAWQLQTTWPPVTVEDEACGAWKPRGLSAASSGPYNPVPLKEAAEALDTARQVGEGESEVDGTFSKDSRRLMAALSGH